MSNLLRESPGYRLIAGDLDAFFLPRLGMLGVSLRHRGVELLRCVEDLDTVAAHGNTAGISLLHPWANRLSSRHYQVAGREVTLDPSSSLLHYDEHGLPIHGIPWPRLSWQIVRARPDTLTAQLDWTNNDLLEVFPFQHRVEMTTTLHPEGLTIETELIAGSDGAVPVSFGFHPHFGLPNLCRTKWCLKLPAMLRLILDRRRIPTGEKQSFKGLAARLGNVDMDDSFALPDESADFTIEGAGLRISVKFLEGYRYAQVFAPKNKNYVALEPMTAATSALTSGYGLRVVDPGGIFRATFRILVDVIR